MATKIRRIIKRTTHVGSDNDTIIADVLDSDSFITLGNVLNYTLSLKTGKKDA